MKLVIIAIVFAALLVFGCTEEKKAAASKQPASPTPVNQTYANDTMGAAGYIPPDLLSDNLDLTLRDLDLVG